MSFIASRYFSSVTALSNQLPDTGALFVIGGRKLPGTPDDVRDVVIVTPGDSQLPEPVGVTSAVRRGTATGMMQVPGRSIGHNHSMRAAKRRRPQRRVRADPPVGVSLSDLALQVSYVGSGEHKSYPSFAGPPKLRADASKCDPRLADRDELTSWLREAFVAGTVGAPWEGEFPRYAWLRREHVVYEARLVNSALGQYKGYPLEAREEPECLSG
jgi:hypothetical protein